VWLEVEQAQREMVPEPLELPEPDEESMELVRKYFDNGYRLMEQL